MLQIKRPGGRVFNCGVKTVHNNLYEIMAGFVVKRLWRFVETSPILRIGMQLKKIASLSAALSNGEDETLVTLKRPQFIQWRCAQ